MAASRDAGRPSGGLLRDAIRLSLGTLTIAPVRPPTRIDRHVSGLAMALAPLVGLVLGLPAAGVLLAGRWLDGGGVFPLLPAALAIATVALLTRGLHLDGLADVADGLGVRGTRDDALSVMKRPDVGAFAVITLVLMLLIQVVALARAVSEGRGTESLLAGLVLARGVMAVSCVRGIPAARPEGLGAGVAGSVPRWVAASVLALAILFTIGLGYVDGEGEPILSGLAVLAALLAAGLLLIHCLRRFGGITGDVLGAVEEVALAAVLVVISASPDFGSPDWAWLFD